MQQHFAGEDNCEQWIILLTPDSEFLGIFVRRELIMDKFQDSSDPTITLYDGDAFVAESEDDFITLDEWNLELNAIRYSNGEIAPDSWHFTLRHNAFFDSTIEKWELEVPNESMPFVRVECNRVREFKAYWAGRDMDAEINEIFGLEDDPPES